MTSDAEGVRLLPWTTPDGAPCYLSTDDPGSRMSRVADEVEAGLLASAEEMLRDFRPLASAPGGAVSPPEVRHAVGYLIRALGDVLRIAHSRGARLPGGSRRPCEHLGTERRGDKVCCRHCGRQLYL
ncbi:hypothetical protein ACWDYJ_25420 [Streptomyces sp. NPDC003042]